jgi:hypothetical protein
MSTFRICHARGQEKSLLREKAVFLAWFYVEIGPKNVSKVALMPGAHYARAPTFGRGRARTLSPADLGRWPITSIMPTHLDGGSSVVRLFIENMFQKLPFPGGSILDARTNAQIFATNRANKRANIRDKPREQTREYSRQYARTSALLCGLRGMNCDECVRNCSDLNKKRQKNPRPGPSVVGSRH